MKTFRTERLTNTPNRYAVTAGDVVKVFKRRRDFIAYCNQLIAAGHTRKQ